MKNATTENARIAQRINDRLTRLFQDRNRHADRLVDLRTNYVASDVEEAVAGLHDTICHTNEDIAYNQELLGRYQTAS